MLYSGLSSISGSLIVVDGVHNPVSGEIVKINENKTGRVVRIDGSRAVVAVFEGTHDMSLGKTTTHFTGRPMQIRLSEEIIGRVFDGIGRPVDGLGQVPGELRDINGAPINPVAREYPRNVIQTGISAIDCLMTLIRGQKLPIFSGDGLPHDKIAAQILRQSGDYSVVFCAMGVQHDTAAYFQQILTGNVCMFINLASDPVVERIAAPRAALTAAEYMAYDLGLHVLVIMTDMTAYAEALREISSSREEIPSRKGYPGYLYSELSSIFERAGIIRGKPGSLTQIPILSMPGDDITHPIPDLTGFITEGQIVLDRSLFQKGIYPPISILPSLSRLMKDGIGEKYTRSDHADIANRTFASYARVGEIRALAQVIGVEELSEPDRKYIEYGEAFERRFLKQNHDENRTISETLDLALELLELLE